MANAAQPYVLTVDVEEQDFDKRRLEGSIFGLGSDLKTEAASLSLMILVAFTVLWEVFTHGLERKIHGTVYMQIVNKVYKELTILGFISFSVTLFVQSDLKDLVDTTTLHAFEFSHVVIFFSAMVFVLDSYFLIKINTQIQRRIMLASKRSSQSILEEYQRRKLQLTGVWNKWFPNDFTAEMEYKVFSIFFCEQYGLPLSVFDFPSYIKMMLDKSVVEMTEVQVTSWVLLCILLCLNLVKLYASKALNPSMCTTETGYEDEEEEEEEEEDHRSLASSEEESSGGCSTGDGLVPFFICGWALLFLFLLLCFFVRRSELKLLGLCGCHSPSDFSLYIALSESKLRAEEKHVLEERVKLQREGSVGGGGGGGAEMSDQQMMLTHMKDTATKKRSSSKKEITGAHEVSKKNQEEGATYEGHEGDNENHDSDGVFRAVKDGFAWIGDKISGASARKAWTERDPFSLPNKDGRPPVKISELLKAASRESTQVDASSPDLQNKLHDEMLLKLGEDLELAEQTNSPRPVMRALDLSSLYLFNSPKLFRKTLDVGLLFNSFYLAVFVSNYAVVSLRYDGSVGPIYFVLCLLPALLIYPCELYIVRKDSIIHAIRELDLGILGKVIDKTEEELNVQHEVFEYFRNKMQRNNVSLDSIKDLFAEFDSDNDGKLDKNEFRLAIHTVGLHMSGHKMKRLFDAVDKDGNGTIDYQEFKALIHPTVELHDVSEIAKKGEEATPEAAAEVATGM